MKLPYYTLESFENATAEELAKHTNGCGAKDGVKVPNTMWGLNIKKACTLHDWMQYKGKTYGDFIFSNVMFFYNLTAIIYNNSKWFTLFFRMERALKYFIGVMSSIGQENYWKTRHKDMSKKITYKGYLK